MMGGNNPINTSHGKPMPIDGRLENERERLQGMTADDRAWRRQWLIDQELSANEPRNIPELRRELTNPIRRFYQKPLDVFCGKLEPVVGKTRAAFLRSFIPKILMGVAAVYVMAYYFKYNHNTWTTSTGWTITQYGRRSLPGDPDYPRVSERVLPSDYYDRGFKSRKVFLD